MQIKKYTAPSLKEAAEKMKLELGSEAVILSTRLINSDEEGPKKFEVVAGIDNKKSGKETVPEPELGIRPGSNYLDELKKLAAKVEADNRKTSIKKEKSRLEISKEKSSFNLKSELNRLGSILLDNEIEKPIVTSIVRQLYDYKSFLNKSNLDKYLLTVIASMIRTENFKMDAKTKPVVVGFLGPTGVGKTTSIAKLATISKILHNLDVGIISIDTYRLGAIDQLRIFSDIVDIDMLVAYEPKDMKNHMKTFKKKDLIFIDTAGRSQKNKEHLQQNKTFLDQVNFDHKYLVLSATSSSKNLIDSASSFELFGYDSFIFSKLDEGVAYGNILNLVNKFDYPVVYLTNGQIIPDDIVSADSDYLAKVIHSGKVN